MDPHTDAGEGLFFDHSSDIILTLECVDGQLKGIDRVFGLKGFDSMSRLFIDCEQVADEDESSSFADFLGIRQELRKMPLIYPFTREQLRKLFEKPEAASHIMPEVKYLAWRDDDDLDLVLVCRA